MAATIFTPQEEKTKELKAWIKEPILKVKDVNVPNRTKTIWWNI